MTPTNERLLTTSCEWYARERPVYEALASSVRAIVADAIAQAGIPVSSITSRAKDVKAFRSKIQRYRYRDPRMESTDLAGVRVICFVESDVERLAQLIENYFTVHRLPVVDTRIDENKDRFDFSLKQYVCDLGPVSMSLADTRAYSGMVFEIQIRTVFQHAWAEIAHNKEFVFSGILDSEHERRLYAQASIIEAVDREFDRISRDIESYSRDAKARIAAGDLNLEINSQSLRSYMSQFRFARNIMVNESSTEELSKAVSALSQLGFRKLKSLDRILDTQLLDGYRSIGVTYSEYELICLALILDRFESYIDWVVDPDPYLPRFVFDMLVFRYGNDFVEEKLRSCEIPVK